MGNDKNDAYSIRCWTDVSDTRFVWSRVSSRFSPYQVSSDQYQISNKSRESTLVLPWYSSDDFYRFAGVYECQAMATVNGAPQRKTLRVAVTHSACKNIFKMLHLPLLLCF